LLIIKWWRYILWLLSKKSIKKGNANVGLYFYYGQPSKTFTFYSKKGKKVKVLKGRLFEGGKFHNYTLIPTIKQFRKNYLTIL